LYQEDSQLRTRDRVLGAVVPSATTAGNALSRQLIDPGRRPMRDRNIIESRARTHTPSPQETDPTNTPLPTSAPPTQAESLPNPEGICTIVWVETGSDGLANKNRAMVWEETIHRRVAGSGMTDRQFYDQVLEHNPELKSDGYVFQEVKTYELPQFE